MNDFLPFRVTAPNEEILRLNVAIDEMPAMHVLDAMQQLHGDHEHRFQRKATIAQVEQVLQAGPEQLHHQRIVLAAWPKVVHVGDAL